MASATKYIFEGKNIELSWENYIYIKRENDERQYVRARLTEGRIPISNNSARQ